MINTQKQIDYWKSGAESDLETAQILIENQKTIQGLFFCHLCIEKITKALTVKETKQIPPKSHDIFYLAKKASIELPPKKQEFIQVLMRYQLEGRYPQNYPSAPSPDVVLNYFSKTKSLFEWFKKKL